MIPEPFKKALAFGSGVGIQIVRTKVGDSAPTESLHIAAVRVRPNGARLVDSFVIEDFKRQPAGVWGTTYSAFLRKLGLRHAVAVVVLPRADVTVRSIAMPGVSNKDLDNAVRFQLDGLSPYKEDDEIYSSWTRLPGTPTVVVAISRRASIDAYEALFEEAGVRVHGFTCFAPAIYSALRLFGGKPAAELLALDDTTGALEFYGESSARPLFTACFDASNQRASSLAASELRIASDTSAIPLAILLGREPAVPFAAALASACPSHSLSLNLLPADRRKASSRLRWVPTAALGSAVLLLAGALAALPSYEQRKYVKSLEAQIASITPTAERAGAIDKQVADLRARIQLLDQLRAHPKADMDVVAEMTRILAPPTWVNIMQISPKQVSVGGETPDATPLLAILDSSRLFEASEFQAAPIRLPNGWQFRLRANRRGAKQ